MKIKYDIIRLNPDVKFPRLLPNKYKIYFFAPDDIDIEPGAYEIIQLGLQIVLQNDCILTLHPCMECNIDEDGDEWNDLTLIEPGNEKLSLIVYNLSDEVYHIYKDDTIAYGSVCKKMNNLVWNIKEETMEVRGGE